VKPFLITLVNVNYYKLDGVEMTGGGRISVLAIAIDSG